MSFGSLLKNKRARAGLTQKEVAEQSGVTLSHYKQLETDRANPSIDSMRRLARLLNIDPREIFDEFDRQDPDSETLDPLPPSHAATDSLRAITHIMETRSPTSSRMSQAVSLAEEELGEADYDELEEIVANMGFHEIVEIPDPSEFEDDEQEQEALAGVKCRIIVAALYGDLIEDADHEELEHIANLVADRAYGPRSVFPLNIFDDDNRIQPKRFRENQDAYLERLRRQLAAMIVDAAKRRKAPPLDDFFEDHTDDVPEEDEG